MFKNDFNGFVLYKTSILWSCLIERLKNIIERILGIKLDENELRLNEVDCDFKIPDILYDDYKFRLYLGNRIRILVYDPFHCLMIDVIIDICNQRGYPEVCMKIDGNVNNRKELDDPFVKLKNELISLQEELSVVIDKNFVNFIRVSLYDTELELQHIHSEKFVSDSISIHDFLKYSEDDCIDDINYSKKIYRISDDALLPAIENHLQNVFRIGKFYRFENVRKSKLFYIENYDLQDISVPGCDDLDYMVDNDGYRIINITPEDFHQ